MQTCYATFAALHSPTLVRTAGCSPPLSARTTSRALNERLCKVLCIAMHLELFNHVRNNAESKSVRENQYLVIAPTLHCGFKRAKENTIVGELSVGDARLNYDEQISLWFDHFLKGEKMVNRRRHVKTHLISLSFFLKWLKHITLLCQLNQLYVRNQY